VNGEGWLGLFLLALFACCKAVDPVIIFQPHLNANGRPVTASALNRPPMTAYFSGSPFMPRILQQMLLAKADTMRQRVLHLRAEIAEISRLNDEYRYISHSQLMEKSHAERMQRLEEILAELKTLSGSRNWGSATSLE
jgi:hypothetical protein